MESLKGQLLISSGGLFDPSFRHTVVLVGEHNEEGALGVVLNRVLDLRVHDVVPALADLVPAGDFLYRGGPVRPQSCVILAQFADPHESDLIAFGSVGFLIGDVSPDVGSRIRRARVFAGYSGWGPGQLEEEMESDSWIVDPAREQDVFTDAPDLLWSRVLQRKGAEYHRLSRVPYDPSMN